MQRCAVVGEVEKKGGARLWCILLWKPNVVEKYEVVAEYSSN